LQKEKFWSISIFYKWWAFIAWTAKISKDTKK
jgi:hypothetical protein